MSDGDSSMSYLRCTFYHQDYKILKNKSEQQNFEVHSMNRKLISTILLAMTFTSSTVFAMKPTTIQDQGSFMAGGEVITSTGTYDGSDPRNLSGKTLHGDHAYVFYQIPIKAKKYSLVFLHGYGQSGKTWETTLDGRDGFQNIFLSRGYKIFIVDQPRRGRAGQSTEPYTFTATPDDQLWYNTFRIGEYPNYYANSQFPRDEESLNQFFHQMTPSFPTDQKIIVDAMVEVFKKCDEGILITHSAGGGPGWETAMHSDKVKAIISLEPGAFPFPEGEVPPTEETTSIFPAIGESVSMENFKRLTKIPIVVYFGDNIPSGNIPVANWGQDNWRTRLNLARKWAQVVNKYGGDVEIVYLPDVGITGNTHFMMADLNNVDVANVIELWLKKKGLAK